LCVLVSGEFKSIETVTFNLRRAVMRRRTICLACFVLAFMPIGKAPAGVPEGTILIGWHTPEVSAPASDSTPDDYLTGVTGLLSGGQDVQADKNSTDATYGSGPATAASTANAIRSRLDQPSRAVVSVQITNNTGGSLYLGTFHFDYSRWYAASPKDVALYYESGDLDNEDNTLINSASELAVAGPTGNYDDFDWSLSVLNDVTLGDGEIATFRLEVSNADQANTAGGFDNIAITSGVSATKASGPSPADMATGALRKPVLSWTPGEFGNQHDIYFGTSFDNVNNATNLDPMGPDQIYRVRQGATSYAIGEMLDFGQTYYWRVDEVNAPSSSNVIFKGDVWSFTVEPFAVEIPGENTIVTASSSNRAEEGPENTLNGSGLDDDDLHSVEQTDMWLSNGFDPNATWIQYEFDNVHKLYQLWVWNYNTTVEPLVGFGIQEATIEYSDDGTNWATLGTTHEFARGPGGVGYAPNTTVDLSGVAAKYVRFTANSNWGGILNQYGLSEVRFLYVPVWAQEPSPDSGATDVDAGVTLNWRAGREAAKHDVYLGTDEQAVIDGNVPVVTVTEPSYVPSLDLAGTYYWRVDEANEAETPATWKGDIWSLSTQEYLVVEDLESYNEIPAGEQGSNLVYLTWIDGFDNPSVNGSTIGYTEAFQPSMETSIVHDGKQSVPLFYNNTVAAYSEVTANIADLQVGQDWTRHGVKALTLRFSGNPANTVQQMYVKINGTKVKYDGSAEETRLMGWQMWYIDLASIGLNLNNVTRLTIGFERIGASGGQGMVLLDAIRLYSHNRQLIVPVESDPAGLQAHYEFEGTTNDSSGNAQHGTSVGNPLFAAGKLGQAISFDGIDDYVNIDGYKGLTAVNEIQPAFSIACWIKTTSAEGELVAWGSSEGAPAGGQYCTFRINEATLRAEHGDGNIRGATPVDDGEWHHVALTVVEGGNLRVPNSILYLNGQPDLVLADSGSNNIYNVTADADVSIGRRASHEDRYFNGLIDEVRIYDRVLTPEEIASLSGRTTAFDKPF
jgi:hypothetical protein